MISILFNRMVLDTKENKDKNCPKGKLRLNKHKSDLL